MAKDISADQVEGGANAGDQVDGGTHEPIQLAAAASPGPPSCWRRPAGSTLPRPPPAGPVCADGSPGAAFATAGSTTAYAIGIDGTVRLPPGTVIAMAEVVGNDLHLHAAGRFADRDRQWRRRYPADPCRQCRVWRRTPLRRCSDWDQAQPAAPLPPRRAGGVGSAGGEFALPGGPIDPNAINLTALLPPTALQFGVPEIEEIGFAFDDDPTVGENPRLIADDDDLSGGNRRRRRR